MLNVGLQQGKSFNNIFQELRICTIGIYRIEDTIEMLEPIGMRYDWGPSSGGANNFFIFFQKAFGSFCSRLAILCSPSSWDLFYTLYTNFLYKRLSLINRTRLSVLLGSLDSWPLYFLDWRLAICISLSYGICLLIFCIFRLLRRNTDLIAPLMIS